MALYASSVEYGLHCLLFLAGCSSPTKASVADLAELQGISPSFVAKLFTKLKKAGLVIANEGAGGGYELARPAERITIWNVVEALEGKKALFKCTEIRQRCALFSASPPAWATKGVCSIHAVMQAAERSMRETLSAHTLADLASRVERKAPDEFSVGVNAWFERRKK
jgi:Rrf2 family protein